MQGNIDHGSGGQGCVISNVYSSPDGPPLSCVMRHVNEIDNVLMTLQKRC